MRLIKLFLTIAFCMLLINAYPAHAEDEKGRVIIRLPEFIIFSEEQLQDAPVEKPEQQPFKDVKDLKADVEPPDPEATPDVEAKDKQKKKTPPKMETGWVYGNSVALLLVKITGDEPPDEAIFKSGLYFFKNEEYKKAINAFKKLMREYPKSDYAPASLYWIGESNYAMGRLKDAIDAYEDVINNRPTSDYWDYAHYSLGWLYANERDYKKAITHFTKATQSPVTSLAFSAQFWVADCLMRLKRYEDAINAFQTLTYPTVTAKPLREDAFQDALRKLSDGKITYREFIVRFPFPESLIVNAAMYGLGFGAGGSGFSFKKEDIKRIKDITWGMTVDIDRQYLEAAFYRSALAYIASNKIDKAMDDAKRLRAINPQSSFSDFIEIEVGLYYYRKRDNAAALKVFQGLSISTFQSEVRPIAEFMVGEILYKEGRLQEALASYEKAEKNVERPALGLNAVYKAGLILYQNREFKKALEKLQPIKDKRPVAKYKDDINYLIAESLAEIKKYDEALLHYQMVPDASPLSEKAQYGRAWVYYRKEKWKEAAEAFNLFLDRYQAGSLRQDALYFLADSYLKMKDKKGYYNAYAMHLIIKDKGLQIKYKDDINYMNYLIAESLAGIRKYDEALLHYQMVPDASPLSEKAQYGRAWVYYRKEKWKEAAEAFNLFLDRYQAGSLRQEAFYRLADSCLNVKDFKCYYNAYARLLKEYPNSSQNTEVSLKAGLALYREERFEDAANIFKNIASAYPKAKEAPEASFRLGWIYFRMNDYKKAVSEFNSHITNYPESRFKAEALLKIGDSYYNLKDYTRALQYYNNIKTGFSKSTHLKDAEYGAILAHKQLGNRDAVLSEAEGFVKRNPKSAMSATLQFQMAEELEAKKRMGDAILAYRKALALSDGGGFADIALYRIGRIFFEQKEFRNAITNFSRLISQYPKSAYIADARYKAAEAYFILGEYEAAIDKYKNFLAFHPEGADASEAMLNMAQSYDKAKNTEDAIKAYNEFIKRFPQHKMAPAAYLAMGRRYYDKMDKKSAVTAYQAAIELADTEVAAEAQFRLAELVLADGRADDAKIEFMKVCYLYPDADKWAALSQLKTAEIYEREKKADTAFAIYQRIKDKAKGIEDIKKASEAAKDIKGVANR